MIAQIKPGFPDLFARGDSQVLFPVKHDMYH